MLIHTLEYVSVFLLFVKVVPKNSLLFFHLAISRPILHWGFWSLTFLSALSSQLFKLFQDIKFGAIFDHCMKEIQNRSQEEVEVNARRSKWFLDLKFLQKWTSNVYLPIFRTSFYHTKLELLATFNDVFIKTTLTTIFDHFLPKKIIFTICIKYVDNMSLKCVFHEKMFLGMKKHVCCIG